jgi:hypothetical protein
MERIEKGREMSIVQNLSDYVNRRYGDIIPEPIGPVKRNTGDRPAVM